MVNNEGGGSSVQMETVEAEDIANTVAWLVSDAARPHQRRDAAHRRRVCEQALSMARSPAAQKAFGPMERRGRRPDGHAPDG